MPTLTKAGHTVTLHDAGKRDRCRHPRCAAPSIRQLADEARRWFAAKAAVEKEGRGE